MSRSPCVGGRANHRFTYPVGSPGGKGAAPACIYCGAIGVCPARVVDGLGWTKCGRPLQLQADGWFLCTAWHLSRMLTDTQAAS